jgi:GET complex subunit GET2
MTPERSNLGGGMGGMEDAFGWDPTQQEHFMKTLMASRSREGTPQFSGLTPQRGASPFPNMADPFATMAPPPPERPKTLLEKLLPLLHATSTILFLLFFVSRTSADITTDSVLSTDYWRRWGELSVSKPSFGWSGEHQVRFLMSWQEFPTK